MAALGRVGKGEEEDEASHVQSPAAKAKYEHGSAWSIWAETVQEQKKMKYLLNKYTRRARNREMSSAWATWVEWVEAVQEEKKIEAAAAR